MSPKEFNSLNWEGDKWLKEDGTLRIQVWKMRRTGLYKRWPLNRKRDLEYEEDEMVKAQKEYSKLWKKNCRSKRERVEATFSSIFISLKTCFCWLKEKSGKGKADDEAMTVS